MDRSPKTRLAFTIPELLVAIAVLVVLAALIFPTGMEVYRSAKQASCLNNVRNYGSAILTLIADKGAYPPSDLKDVNFGNALVPGYLAEIPRCPLANQKERAGTGSFAYAGNAPLVFYFDKLKGVPAPSGRIVLAAECCGKGGFNSPTHFNMTMWGTSDADSKDLESMTENEGKVRRPQYHGGAKARGLNVLFLDGSGALIRPAGGDWRDPETQGTATNGGYFYERNQFRLMSEGKLKVP